jgi:YbbR domain-containing protein
MNLLERLITVFTANLGTKLISVIIAMVLWAVVLGSRNIEATKEVPLEVITPADVVAANDIPEHISFKMTGPKAFLRAILDRKEEPIRVNLSGSKPGLVTYRFFQDNIHLPIGVKVQSINPTAILIKLEYLKRREVPVKVELHGIPPEGYRVVRTEVKPETVRIKGAESRIDGVTEIFTLPFDVSDLRESITKELPLDLARANVQLDGDLPKVFFEVESTQSANFRIKNIDVRVLTPYKYTIDEREKGITVLVRAAPKDLKSLDASRFYALVDLRGRPKGKYQESVKVTMPDNVSLVKVIPEKVNVTLY